MAVFPFYLLAPLKVKGPIFSFFLGDFLKAFPVLHFCGELAAKTFFKNVNLLDLESSLLALGILSLNINKLYSIFIFKPLISLKNNSRGAKVTSFSVNSFFLVLTVEASTKN